MIDNGLRERQIPSNAPAATGAVPASAIRLARRVVPSSAPPVIVVLAAVAWAVVFGVHVYWRHSRFGTPDHDLGIWDQATWLLAHGRSFDTVRGLRVFGFHVSPALYLYAPFYWLGAGANLLNLSMVASLAIGAWPVFRIARHHLGREWQALVLSLAYLITFAAQWMVQETFHPEVVAITPLLFAYLAAVEGRWRAFAAWLLFAVMWKEDVAIAGAMVGLVLAWRGERTITGAPAPSGTRRAGLWAAGLCALWFVVASRLVIPAFSPAGGFTDDIFGDLGGSPTELAGNAVTDPGMFVDQLEESEPHHYLRELTAAYGFVPLLSPVTLLMGLPQALINLLAQYSFFWVTRVHYAAIPLLASTLAAIEGVARFRRPEVRTGLLVLVATGALYTGAMWGISPVSPLYRTGHWLLTPHARQEALEAVVELPGSDDAVSSYTWLVPHLSHREEIYTFPNPWLANNWGVGGENRPDPDDTDWLIVDPSALSDRDRAVLLSALDDPARALELDDVPAAGLPTGPLGEELRTVVDARDWEIVVDQPELIALRRIRTET